MLSSGGQDTTGHESSKSTPDGAFLLEGDGRRVTGQPGARWCPLDLKSQHWAVEQRLPFETRINERLSWDLPLS